jgi:hypothetical protein
VLFIDPDGRNFFKNLWNFTKETYKSTTINVSAGLQAGANVEIANKNVGAHVNLLSGNLEVLNNGEWSVNNTSTTQGANVSVGLLGAGVESEVKDNGNATKVTTISATAAIVEVGTKTTSEHKEMPNGTYKEISSKTEVLKPTATVSLEVQAFVGVEIKVDVWNVWQAFRHVK